MCLEFKHFYLKSLEIVKKTESKNYKKIYIKKEPQLCDSFLSFHNFKNLGPTLRPRRHVLA